jgi:hypothetical protein
VSSGVRMCVKIGGCEFMFSEKCRWGLITQVTLIKHHTWNITVCNDSLWCFSKYCVLFWEFKYDVQWNENSLHSQQSGKDFSSIWPYLLKVPVHKTVLSFLVCVQEFANYTFRIWVKVGWYCVSCWRHRHSRLLCRAGKIFFHWNFFSLVPLPSSLVC